MHTYYCSIVPLSFEERVNKYLQFSKEDLAKMMAERDKTINPNACLELIENNNLYNYTQKENITFDYTATEPNWFCYSASTISSDTPT